MSHAFGSSVKTLTIDIPDTVEMDATDAKAILASKLFEQGALSLGKAAEFAGVNKRRFIEALSVQGISIFTEDVESLDTDLRNVQNHHL